MATVALRKFTNADTLKRIGGHYLLPLLSPHRPFFAGRGLILPEWPRAEGQNGNSTPQQGAPHPAPNLGLANGSPHPQPLSTPREHLIRPAATFSPSDAEKGNPMVEGGVGLSTVEAESEFKITGNGHIDCEKLASIFMTPDTDMPRDLADALYLIHEMSTKEAMDKLQEAAERCRPPLNLDGADEPADVAVRVWLLNRSLIEEVNAEHELARPKAFLSYLTDENPVPKFVVPSEATRREWEKRMDEWFEKKKRGSGCRLLIYPRDGECWFLIRHGEPFRREGSYDGGDLRHR